MSKAQRELVRAKIEIMLNKGAISQIDHTQGKFISLLVLFVPYEHSRMESLNLLQFLLNKGYYMIKLDLKDAYFCVPLHKESQKFVRF